MIKPPAGSLPRSRSPEEELLKLVQWTARIGAVTAEALAHLEGATLASARGRLGTATRRGLLERQRLVTDRPSLYTVTRSGLRAARLAGADPIRLSTANFAHTLVCANVAAALQRTYPDHTVVGEHELRREERQLGRPVASAQLTRIGASSPVLHRPDLVMWAGFSPSDAPVAIEVELTVKSPQRLVRICRAWARSRAVAGVVYLAAPAVERALGRAVEVAQAGERIAILPLGAVALTVDESRPRARSVPSGA
jgi:hypothetical protein